MKQEEREGLVLVGFGSHRLIDMLEWIGSSKEEELLTAFKRWPPVYRELRICSPEETKAAWDFLAFIKKAIDEYEGYKSKNKEKTDGNE